MDSSFTFDTSSHSNWRT